MMVVAWVMGCAKEGWLVVEGQLAGMGQRQWGVGSWQLGLNFGQVRWVKDLGLMEIGLGNLVTLGPK